MPKMFPTVALGYGSNGNKSSTPGMPIAKVGSAGSDLVRDIRANKGWGSK